MNTHIQFFHCPECGSRICYPKRLPLFAEQVLVDDFVFDEKQVPVGGDLMACNECGYGYGKDLWKFVTEQRNLD